jgi:hypothetical protein
MKIRPVGVELFHADGHTATTKLIVALHNFANASKNESIDLISMLLRCHLFKIRRRNPLVKNDLLPESWL